MRLSGFRAHFRACMGRNVYQYIMAYRIHSSMIDLKKGDQNVAFVADRNGFPTLSCFLRKFKKATGVAPRSWATLQTE